MEDGVIRTMIEVVGGGIMTGLGFFARRHHERIRRIENSIDTNAAQQRADNIARQNDLYAYRIDAGREFAKEATVQHSLDRIHGRLDDLVDLLTKR